MAGKILEAELRITGSDKSGAAFAGVIKHAEELRSALGKIGNMGLGTAQLQEQSAAIKQGTAALRLQNTAWREINRSIALGNQEIGARTGMINRMRERVGGMMAGVGMYGWMAGGYAAGRVAHAAAHDTSDFQHQKAMLETTTGMSKADVERAVRTAQQLNVPLMSATENLKALGELRMVFGSTEHAIDNVGSVQRAAAMLKGINPDKNSDVEAYDLARALELKGVSMDPAHFNRLNSSLVQAVNASRGKVTGESLFEFTQYSRGAARGLSDFFYTRIAPSLIQEMRPTSAGRAISSLYEQVVGGKMKLQAATEWLKLGLLDPHKVELNKIGTVKRVAPGAFTDSALFVSDPYAWIQRYLAPALKKHGITDPAKVSEELAHLFSNMYAEQMAGILLTQKQRLEKDAGLIQQAPGTEALEKLRETDTKAALTDLAAGINSLLAALGSPLAGSALLVMNKLSDAARAMGRSYFDLAKDHPAIASQLSLAGGLGLGYAGLKGIQATLGLFTGSTALKGSAAALTGSAAALDAAATRLGAAGVANGPWSKVAGGAGVGAGFGGGLRAALAAGARGGVPLALTVGGLAVMKHDAASGNDLRSRLREMLGISDPHEPAPWLPGGAWRKPAGDLSGGLRDNAGKAELTGTADLRTKITVEPTPYFWTKIETMISNGIHALHIDGAPGGGTAGSTGTSMPEAFPTGAP